MASNCFGQLKSQVLHGDIGQSSRQATIRQFKEGGLDVLVATDVAARGLDIAGVDLVLHTAPPSSPDDYVHRSGRTGRAGRNGTSILFFTDNDERRLPMFERSLNFKFERAGPPTAKQISEASAAYAAKKLSTVNDHVTNYFVPYARRMINQLGKVDFEDDEDEETDMTSDDEASEDGEDGNNEEEVVDEPTYTQQEMEMLLAKCLACISNRNSIKSRSLLTGETGITSLQVEAVFRYDWWFPVAALYGSVA